MTLIKKLQECSTIKEADPILTEIGAGPAIKKLVETAIILNNSKDPNQRSHAFSFMESAIKEMEDDPLIKDKLHEEEDPEKDKKDKENKVREEELSNLNQGQRTDGSEQSSDNTLPLSGEGTSTPDGENSMQNVSNTENQFSEMDTGMILPGLPPNVAQEIGSKANYPAMSDKQMVETIQHAAKETANYMFKKYIIPLNETVKKLSKQGIDQTTALRTLSQEIQETKASSGTMKLDLDHMRQNAPATFRETTIPLVNNGYAGVDNPGMPGAQPVNTKHSDLQNARNEIAMMDKILSKSNTSIYN